MDDFSLNSEQVPNVPTQASWKSVLRWLVCVMDADDKILPFVASCLAYAIKNDGLSEKQHLVCEKISIRIRDAHNQGVLVCQNTDPSDEFLNDTTERAVH